MASNDVLPQGFPISPLYDIKHIYIYVWPETLKEVKCWEQPSSIECVRVCISIEFDGVIGCLCSAWSCSCTMLGSAAVSLWYTLTLPAGCGYAIRFSVAPIFILRLITVNIKQKWSMIFYLVAL